LGEGKLTRAAGLVRFIHVFGLFARREGPLAMMVSVDRSSSL